MGAPMAPPPYVPSRTGADLMNPMVEQQFRDGQLKPVPCHTWTEGSELTYQEFEERLECFQRFMASGRRSAVPKGALDAWEESIRGLVDGHGDMLQAYIAAGHRMCPHLYNAIYGGLANG